MSFTAAQADAEEERRRAAREQPVTSAEERKRLISAADDTDRDANRRNAAGNANGNANANVNANANANANANNNAGNANGNNANANANGNGNGNGNNNGGGNGGGAGGGVRRLDRLVTGQQARELSACWDAFSTWVIVVAVLWGLVAIMWLCTYAYEVHLWSGYRHLNTYTVLPGEPAPAPDTYCEKRLPMWLGVDGFTGLWFLLLIGAAAVVIYTLILKAVEVGRDEAHRTDDERQQALAVLWPHIWGLIALAVVLWLTAVFRICWAIVGSVWVFTIDKQLHLCPAPVYNFQWLRAALGWGWVGVMVVLICVSVCLLLCLVKPNTDNTTNNANNNNNAAGNANANNARP